MGHVDNPYPLMACADIAVQPSRWEGFGVAMGELLALGVPLLTTDCPGGFRDVMGGAGIVVPSDDPAALADAITRLAGDTALRQEVAALGPASIARCTSRPLWLARSWTWSRRSSITPGRPAVTAERTP